jgi:phosphoribosylformylglycinamidine (FGAM) synthase-like enzyme
VGKTVPKVRIEQARKTMISVINAIDSGYVKSCHDLSEGGLAVAAAEMALSGDHGVELDLKNVPKSSEMKRNDYILFS